jgi:hypothetical protein
MSEVSDDRQALIKQVELLHQQEDRIAELEEALSPFIRLHDWLVALDSLGEFEHGLTPADIVCQFSGGGGSDSLRWSDFLRAARTRRVTPE